MNAYLCHWCKTIYIGKRPQLCQCKSNAFFKKYETTEKEIKELENSGAMILTP